MKNNPFFTDSMSSLIKRNEKFIMKDPDNFPADQALNSISALANAFNNISHREKNSWWAGIPKDTFEKIANDLWKLGDKHLGRYFD